jgi:hypothetical protein
MMEDLFYTGWICLNLLFILCRKHCEPTLQPSAPDFKQSVSFFKCIQISFSCPADKIVLRVNECGALVELYWLGKHWWNYTDWGNIGGIILTGETLVELYWLRKHWCNYTDWGNIGVIILTGETLVELYWLVKPMYWNKIAPSVSLSNKNSHELVRVRARASAVKGWKERRCTGCSELQYLLLLLLLHRKIHCSEWSHVLPYRSLVKAGYKWSIWWYI